MNNALILPAPAKLNRMLHITGRRADGYHELQTLFQFLEYGDTLHFLPRSDGQTRLHTEVAGIGHDDNLIVRAARRLQSLSERSCGVDITLEKRLPQGGGLGGGSSDAATTLLALDRLWHLDLGEDRLAAIGLELGADVPVFIRGFAAWGEGIGERLQPAPLDRPWFVVIHPGVSVSTGALFNHPELTRQTPSISMARALQGGHNDCEQVARSLQPCIGEAIDWLKHFGSAMMTGTGSCVFCPLSDREKALRIMQATDRKYPQWQTFVAQGCNISPLHAALK
ncbi:4-(cytidine 5'-diphospho)-2-C-methyl-D-erythritol kinase [Kushneria phosphatilytica]|uniref:4-diphosphocytidyl-2-C-methyl-D-erythritol kinase n=1 Tax=Kushneria phosphatilytica TaxID=657387 RepID=A0A1S1NY39_9GAMM|nr:4-(cytidine 5'-diphospho)-2-C-methyl-D-erythritol kinase [Kushneria phosphatilytica]OHV12286.1 4-(cytidine 5'-diphospho)-2-C-methyl-D-erythritol kinase [Kushneria phosphatilytica]QEL11491.1 4-(cytidine 5'-diphospho)-2-C-methyl-D-erythritol kinase [Kushneria phosphatilytica]